MSNKEKLVDRYVEIDEEKEKNTTFIYDLNVTDDYTVVGNSLVESDHQIFDLWELESKTVDEILERKEDNIDFSDSCINKMKEIEIAFNITYNNDYDMYELKYNRNQYDQIHEIYVHFDTDYIEDIEIHKIYNSEGKFVANSIESQIGSDLMHIESYNLFVDTIIDPNRVYRKKETDIEYIEDNYIKSDNLIKEFKETSLSFFMAFFPYLFVFHNPYLTIPILIYMMTNTFDDYFMRGLDIFGLLFAIYPYYKNKKQISKFYNTDSSCDR